MFCPLAVTLRLHRSERGEETPREGLLNPTPDSDLVDEKRFNESARICHVRPRLISVQDVTGHPELRSPFSPAHHNAQPLQDQTQRELVYCPLEFHERGEFFIGAHDETLSVAVRVNNPD